MAIDIMEETKFKTGQNIHKLVSNDIELKVNLFKLL